MDIIEFKKTDLLKGPSIPLGSGKTANCFLTPNLDVVKIYKHNFDAEQLLKNKDFSLKLERLGNISNETFIGPDSLLYTKDKLVGYTYKYCVSPTLSVAGSDTTLTKLFINYDRLLEDIKKVSNGHLRIRDSHYKNILFDGIYHMIDLDHSEFRDEDDVEELYSKNASRLFKAIVKHIYGVNPSHTLMFDDKDLNLVFNHMDKTNLSEVEEFQRIITKKCETPNPTIKQIKRKVKARGYNMGYNGKNEE